MTANGEDAAARSVVQVCRTCGADIFSPDYGGDLDDYHADDKTEAWPYCKRPGTATDG